MSPRLIRSRDASAQVPRGPLESPRKILGADRPIWALWAPGSGEGHHRRRVAPHGTPMGPDASLIAMSSAKWGRGPVLGSSRWGGGRTPASSTPQERSQGIQHFLRTATAECCVVYQTPHVGPFSRALRDWVWPAPGRVLREPQALARNIPDTGTYAKRAARLSHVTSPRCP